MERMTFTGTDIEFDPQELADVIGKAIEERYGKGFVCQIHNIHPGEYSDDVELQIIGG